MWLIPGGVWLRTRALEADGDGSIVGPSRP